MKLKLLLLPVVLFTIAAFAQTMRTIPEGTTVKVRTDTAIPAKPAAGASYTATISDDVTDKSGGVVIPKGSRAQLVAQASPDGKDTNLDLRSVTVSGRRYLLTTASAGKGAPGGLGANKKTAKYVGGGAALGAILGGIFGGGKGAAIGALAGGGAGAGAQVYRGRKKDLPAESELSFKLAQDLQMRASGASSSGGLKKRP